MEPDFVTRQHTESLVPSSDPSIAEVLNNYKFPPETPQPQMPSPMAGYNPQFGSSNNEMLLGTMLGQMQANMQNKNPAQSPGFQLNINTEVLRWLIVLLLVATLIWIIFRVSRKEKSPLRRRLRKLERNYRKLYKARRKNPKALPDSDNNDTSDFLDDDLDDLDDFDDLDY